MQYRRFGKIEKRVSLLGFGAMRLPLENNGKVDKKEAIRMIRYAIDKGINYIDTAYVYHSGTSEVIVGKALGDGYRDKVMIATKSPITSVNSPSDFDRILSEQLKRLKTDRIDCYLFHGIDRHSWKKILELNLLEKAENSLRNGLIGHIGFSFHDDCDTFRKIVDGYDKWEFCLIQYNYMDTEKQAGTEGLRYAASKGLGIAIMEPLLGGRLSNPPEQVKRLFDEYHKSVSPSDWALQWIWSHPEVSVILSGMSTMDQVERNIRSAENADMQSFGEDEFALINRVRQGFNQRTAIPCTRCGYCMDCPNGVNIPRNFELYNDAVVFNDPKGARFVYDRFFNPKERACNCIQCMVCEDKCPQKIEISAWMPKVHASLGEGKPF
jgi:predicted aldo/keto reductase-like oxidoreductase